MDADEPEEAVIELILKRGASDTADKSLLSELEGMRLKDLRTKARESGVSAQQLASAMDSGEPEQSVIAMIVAMPCIAVFNFHRGLFFRQIFQL